MNRFVIIFAGAALAPFVFILFDRWHQRRAWRRAGERARHILNDDFDPATRKRRQPC